MRLPGVALAGFDRRSFFDFDGNALPVVNAFGQLSAPIRIRAHSGASALTLQWPLSGAALSLASCTNLTQPLWAPVTNTVETTGAMFSVTLPTDDPGVHWYRLQ